MKRFVIFSGYNERAIVAFCRQLRDMRVGFSIVARDADDPILKTAYRTHVAAVRSTPLLTREDVGRCLALVRAHDPADAYVICPSSEFLNHFLLRHRAWLREERCNVPLVDDALYQIVTNKASFRALSRDAGLAVPWRAEPVDRRFPFVAKPRTNITAAGQSLYPILVFSEADWAAAGAPVHDPLTYYYEDFIEGPSYYLLYYFPWDTKAPIYAWSQQNLLQQPHGKSMVCAVSDTLHEAPVGRRIAEMLRNAGFHGLAMVEVIERGGEYYVIEMNPRLWGPCQLLRNARVDLIKAFVEESLTGRITHADPFAGRPASYLWLGGVKGAMVWHAPKPMLPWLSLTAHLGSDVYLRPDTFRVFIDEFIKERQ